MTRPRITRTLARVSLARALPAARRWALWPSRARGFAPSSVPRTPSRVQEGQAMATRRLPHSNRRTTALLGVVLSMGLCVGALASATPAAAAGTISFAPTAGAPGSSVLITGSGVSFDSSSTVTFGGTKAVAQVENSSQISAIVPAMPSSSVPIRVTTEGIGVTGAKTFKVVPGLVLTPATGPPGSTVGVSGGGFGKSETISVSFAGTKLPTAPVTNSSGSFGPVSIKVPAAVIGGSHTISAVGGTTGLQAQAVFTVTPAIAVTPATGPPGSAVTVSGAGFGNSEGLASPSTAPR